MDVARIMIRTFCSSVLKETLNVSINGVIFKILLSEDSFGPLRIPLIQGQNNDKSNSIASSNSESEEGFSFDKGDDNSDGSLACTPGQSEGDEKKDEIDRIYPGKTIFGPVLHDTGMGYLETTNREVKEGIRWSFDVVVKAAKEASLGRQKESGTYKSNFLDSDSSNTRVSCSIDTF